jgi:hypothetical protein
MEAPTRQIYSQPNPLLFPSSRYGSEEGRIEKIGALRDQMGGFRYLPGSAGIIVRKDNERQTMIRNKLVHEGQA